MWMTWGWIVTNVEDRGQKTEDRGSGERFTAILSARQADVLRLWHDICFTSAQGDYTMKKIIEKIVDAILELVAGSFEIDPCNLKDEDMATDASRLGAAAG